MNKKFVSRLIRDIVPSPIPCHSRTSSCHSRESGNPEPSSNCANYAVPRIATSKGFTLLEVMVVTTILATLATTTLVTLNPTELLAQMRDSQRITTIGMLRDAISLLVADAPATNLGDVTRVHISLPSNDPNCADIVGLPTLPSGMFYRCVTAANLTRIDGHGWIPLNFNNIVGGAPFTVLPTDIINTPALFYSYIPSPGGRATLTARIESIRQRTLHPTEIFTTHFTSAVDRPPLGTGQVTVPMGSIASPSYSFVGDLNTGIFSPLADSIGFSTFGTERMRIDHTGFVGIGTPTPGQRLTVAGVIHSTTGGFMFPDGTTQITAGGAGGGGTLPAGTLTGQTLRWTTTPNSWLATSNLFNDGTNVGIGTTAPLAQLHLADIFTAGGRNLLIGDDAFLTDIDLADTLGIHGNQNSAIASIRLGSGGGIISGSAGNVGIGMTAPLSRVQIQGHGTTTAGTLNVTASDGASRFFVRDDGNVGIGTTSPTTRLDIEGQIRIRGGTPAAGRVLTADATGLATWATPAGGLPTGTASQTLRHDGTNWVANSNIFNDGTNVGIGMTAPAERLDVAGNVRAVDVRWGAGGSRGIHLADGFDLNNLTDAGWYDVNNAANRPPVAYGWTRVMVTRGHSPMWVHQQASDLHRDRMWHRRSWYAGGGVRAWGPWQEIWDAEGEATFTGNVGIGTTAPTARLHVAGTSRFDGVVDMTNHRITNLPPPIAASDAATRAYVDAAGAAISFELSCGWITTGNPPAVGTCSPPACPAGFSAAPVGCMVSAIISPPAAALDGAAHGRAYRPSGWWSVTGGSGTWGGRRCRGVMRCGMLPLNLINFARWPCACLPAFG